MKKKTTQPKHRLKTFFRRLSYIGIGKQVDLLVENLALLATAGISISEALKSLAEDARSKTMRALILGVEQRVVDGVPLWRALKEEKVFPEHVVALVRVGEETGRLSSNLQVIVSQSRKQRQFKSRVMSAMMYPVIVFGLILVVGIGIAWFILPRLASVFDELDVELPAITKALISVGTFLSSYGAIVVPVFILGLVLGVYFLFFHAKTRHIGQGLLFKMPGINRLVQEVELARFGFFLGTLLHAGLPITSALASLSYATIFPSYRKLYSTLYESILEGHSFRHTFTEFEHSKQYVPVAVQQLIAAAEQSGKLSETFMMIGETFEAKVEVTMKNLTVLLEPILLIIIWMGVVLVALAVIVPIYSLVGQLNP